MRPVPEYDAKSWLLKALRETAHAMETLIWNVDEDVLEQTPECDEWSCKDLAAHMCEMERRYIDRLERVVRLDDPRIDAFDADSLDPRPHVARESIYDLMDEFSVQRQQSVYLLWSLDSGDWSRKGVHPYLGPLTITELAREMNEHDLSHLWQLRRVCDQFEPASA